MKPTLKLSSTERRAAIIQAVRRVFSERGFHGTTTRALADAAGVSEALLFRHFPTKEALYTAMQQACCSEDDHVRFERLLALEPSTSTLVLLMHFLVWRMVGTPGPLDEGLAIQHRLMARSLAEDGEFARLFTQRLEANWIPKLQECLDSARQSGDAVTDGSPSKLTAWFANHVVSMIVFNLLPDEPVIDYAAGRRPLVEHAVRFVLRGMGLTDEAIRRHYNPGALALFEE